MLKWGYSMNYQLFKIVSITCAISFFSLHGMNETSFVKQADSPDPGAQLTYINSGSGTFHRTISQIAIANDKVVIVVGSRIQAWDIKERALDFERMRQRYGFLLTIKVDNNKIIANAIDESEMWDITDGRYLGLHARTNFKDKTKYEFKSNQEGHFLYVNDRPLIKWDGPNISLCSLIFSGDTIIYGSDSGTIKRWNKNDGSCIKTFDHGAPVYIINVFGNRLLSVSPGKIKIWDINSGRCVRTLACEGTVSAITLNGQYLAAGYDDGRFQVWQDNNMPELGKRRMLALAEGLHPRLGSGSIVGALPPWFIQDVGKYVIPESWA